MGNACLSNDTQPFVFSETPCDGHRGIVPHKVRTRENACYHFDGMISKKMPVHVVDEKPIRELDLIHCSIFTSDAFVK
jgi:hypothetical protein